MFEPFTIVQKINQKVTIVTNYMKDFVFERKLDQETKEDIIENLV